MVSNDVYNLILKYARLSNSVIHGATHWKAVERNGLYLCQFNDADKKVVSYFSYFHDCMRENDGFDREHGPRAAEFIKNNKEKIDLNEQQLNKLILACRSHTFGHSSQCITIKTCWDADRLDIGRVGIIPDENYLFNEEAKRIAREKDYVKLYKFNNKK